MKEIFNSGTRFLKKKYLLKSSVCHIVGNIISPNRKCLRMCDWMTHGVKVAETVCYHWTLHLCMQDVIYSTKVTVKLVSDRLVNKAAINQLSHPTQRICTMLVPQPQGIPRTSWDIESRLPCFWGTDKKKFQSGSAPLAKFTAHPKSFAAKSIIIITCGDEFPMMVAGPQQHLLIMTFCSCWQSLPVRWLIPNSQHVRRSTHTILC